MTARNKMVRRAIKKLSVNIIIALSGCLFFSSPTFSDDYGIVKESAYVYRNDKIITSIRPGQIYKLVRKDRNWYLIELFFRDKKGKLQAFQGWVKYSAVVELGPPERQFDIIYMKNGIEFKGVILEKTPQSVKILLKSGGTTSLSNESIIKIEYFDTAYLEKAEKLERNGDKAVEKLDYLSALDLYKEADLNCNKVRNWDAELYVRAQEVKKKLELKINQTTYKEAKEQISVAGEERLAKNYPSALEKYELALTLLESVKEGVNESELLLVKENCQKAIEELKIKLQKMVLIPSGYFQMGSPPSEIGRDEDEGPVHKVYVDAFYIDKYEVTQRDFEALMGYNPSEFKDPEKPVENVSWVEAARYCNARSRKEGLTPYYNEGAEGLDYNFEANGYRLPTEAEWEKAARGGLVGKRYPWGDEIDESKANYAYITGTKPVGSYPPNGYGLYDMAGNVWEWCNDWYGKTYYKESPTKNPKGPGQGRYHVVRGGGWSEPPRVISSRRAAADCRSANRSFVPVGRKHNYIGFRCVRRP